MFLFFPAVFLFVVALRFLLSLSGCCCFRLVCFRQLVRPCHVRLSALRFLCIEKPWLCTREPGNYTSATILIYSRNNVIRNIQPDIIQPLQLSHDHGILFYALPGKHQERSSVLLYYSTLVYLYTVTQVYHYEKQLSWCNQRCPSHTNRCSSTAYTLPLCNYWYT